jgi:hypothetical protein
MINLAHSATLLETNYQNQFEAINQEIKHELLFGDLSKKSVKRSLQAKIKKIAPLARKIGGLKYKIMVVMSFEKTLLALSTMNKNYKTALDMSYANGLTGREIILAALDADNNKKIVEIYNQNKVSLGPTYSGKELRTRAMDLTLEQLDHDQNFAFLQIAPVENYVMKDGMFNFIKDKCTSRFGEEDFFLLIFGFNRCFTEKYRVDRWTVGAGFFSASKGYSYVTGLKIGKKGFKGVGVRVKVGVKYAGGIGVFIGNGLMLSLDLESSYGLYAGATYFNLMPK